MAETWEAIKERAKTALLAMPVASNKLYIDRLQFEIDQVEMQGSNRYWQELVNDGKTFNINKNHLLLPWLLGICVDAANVDPIATRTTPTLCTSKYSKVVQIIQSHGLPPDLFQDKDQPDIDIDCLPTARDPIKAYAAQRYGEKNVCSVGTMNKYLLKQAITDVTKVLGYDKAKASKLTTELPKDVDDMQEGGFAACKGKVITGDVEKDCKFKHNAVVCPKCGSPDTEHPTFAQLMVEHKELKAYYESFDISRTKDNILTGIRLPCSHVIDTAVNLVGRYKSIGKHAGALIIADRDLFGSVPMYKKNGQWVSVWTEGRNPQLSKFGYMKWDVLGLRNLQYITAACQMIEENHGVSFGERMCGWDDVDPENDIAGRYWKDGVEHIISLNDPRALSLADQQKTDAVFQFDTDCAKGILSNGVYNFGDLLTFNAMGHPGPMQCIPEYVERRNDTTGKWKLREHDAIVEVLQDTHGIIVFQESLQALWQNIAGFTAPEAQEARKAVAKKWREKLKPVEQKWIDGASKVIGREAAVAWWAKMTTFGRYAFNKSHAVAYCLIAYRCLWLKAYYPAEWWAAVMSYCQAAKLTRYMNVARSESVQFGPHDIGKLTTLFTVHNSRVALGLASLKRVGLKTAESFADTTRQQYANIDEFVEKKGKNKTVIERLIKLGAFNELHGSSKGTWVWYLYAYASAIGKEFAGQYDSDLNKVVKGDKITHTRTLTAFRNHIRNVLLTNDGWNDKTITAERDRQISEYKRLYPKRTKVPPKILNWKPKPADTRENVMRVVEHGEFGDPEYTLDEILLFEKEYLGYYWHSPVDLFRLENGSTIKVAKEADSGEACLQGVVVRRVEEKTKDGKPMLKLIITDGTSECLLMLWDTDIKKHKQTISDVTAVGTGIKCQVKYDEKRNNFTLQRHALISKLWKKTDWVATGGVLD